MNGYMLIAIIVVAFFVCAHLEHKMNLARESEAQKLNLELKREETKRLEILKSIQDRR